MLILAAVVVLALAAGLALLLSRRSRRAPAVAAAALTAAIPPSPSKPPPAPEPVRSDAAPAAQRQSAPAATKYCFISYSSKDKPTADAVCAVMEGCGVRCWIAPRDILPGHDWAESILRAIGGAKACVLIFSASANASPQVRREIERAVHNEVPVIPFRIEDTAPSESLEYFISTPHWLDALNPPLEAHAKRLAQSALAMMGETGAPRPD